MIVTDKKYHLEDRLIKKLNLMIKRCDSNAPKRDVLLIVEGSEGEGKTTLSAQIAYYVSQETGRPFSHENLFFDVQKMIDFAKNTKKQIIVWDEPAAEGLAADWFRQTQKDLIKLLMMARKNQHFFIFNLTKFYKFPEYIVVDRAIGLIHVYSRRGIISGRFLYIRNGKLEALYRDYRSKKLRNYNKHRSFGGSFTKTFGELLDEEAYDANKDKAIQKIGASKKQRDLWREKFNDLRKRVGLVQFPVRTKEEFAQKTGYSTRSLRLWAQLPVQVGFTQEMETEMAG